MSTTARILQDVVLERINQEDLREQGKFRATCATTGPHSMTDPECLAVLDEEVGEAYEAYMLMLVMGRVARDVAEGIKGNIERGRTNLRTELIQVAAVAVAWIDRLDDC